MKTVPPALMKRALILFAVMLAAVSADASARGFGRGGYGGRGFGRSRHDHAGHFFSVRFEGTVVKDWKSYVVQEDLKSGRTRQRILAVQRSLAAQGIYRGPKNGVLDAATRRAIQRFQGSEDIPVTGAIDAFTWVALGFKTSDLSSR